MQTIFDRLSELRDMIRNKGFWDTLNILNEYRNIREGISVHDFFGILNTYSFYNSFYRVKQELLSYKIIEIYVNSKYKKKLIRLTEKGKEIYDILTHLKNCIELQKTEKRDPFNFELG